MSSRWIVVVLAGLVCAACGREDDASASEVPTRKAAAARMTKEAYTTSRRVYADSVLRAAKSAPEVAREIGQEVHVAPARMTDSLTALSGSTDCFVVGRNVDPYLAGTVNFAVYMSAIGSSLIQVNQSNWTSAAGNVVNACLNLRAKEWYFGPRDGPWGIVVGQVRFK